MTGKPIMRYSKHVFRRCGIAVALVAAGIVSSTSTVHAASPADVQTDFVRDVAPILAAHCVRCHGAEVQEGGLRLDRRDHAFRGGDSGVAIVPSRSAASLLLTRAGSKSPDERMPPAEAGRALSRDEVTRLKRWIDAGASWPTDGADGAGILAKHWAYQPVVRPALPHVERSDWVRAPVDAFVLQRLEQQEIAPSPEAEASTLVRRLYLDLTGLLPTPNEAAEFVDGRTSYAALVDKLLASPHFGERWGRHWLDLARYADSNGYELDIVRPNAWRYRDWVIDAVNADLPFDRFIVEQLAGDLLPDASRSQQTATGFHRMTIKNTESGINAEDYRNREMVDRVNTTASAVLGITLGCAQCHTHKYDPFTIDEYYGFYAFFNNVEEVEIDLEGTGTERAALAVAVSDHFDKWLTLQAKQRLIDELIKQGPEQSAKAVASSTENAHAQLEAQRSLAKLGLDAWLKSTSAEEQKALSAPPTIANFLKPDAKSRKKFEAAVDRYLSSLPLISDKLEQKLNSKSGYAAYLGDSAELAAALTAVAAERTAQQSRLVAEFFASLPAQQDEVKQNLRLLVTEERYLPNPQILALKENRASPRPTHVLLRGDFKQHGDEVRPGTPAVLPALKPRGNQADRLDLAQWLVDPKNPLTSRVAVNHVWTHLFGRGLVSTVDDFGIRGERPSHPELLDWLADEFRRVGWSRKQLIRTIVTSSAYRQSSAYRDEWADVDPDNTLLARQRRFRVEAEIVRDLFLSASGLLDHTVGGASVYPVIPDAVRDIAYKYQLIWPTSAAPDCYRRGMYVHFRRSNPYPSLTVFDAPEGTQCTAQRNRSNTPLQALTTMNDPVFVENARALGRRLVAEGSSDASDRVRRLFAICLSREPQPAEARIITQLVESERAAYQRNPQLAAQWLGVAKIDSNFAETAAWVAAARAVLNLDEFVTRE